MKPTSPRARVSKSQAFALLSSFAIIAACSGSSAGIGPGEHGSMSANSSARAEQTNGSCPATPAKLTGHGAAGSHCTTFADCKPTCCSCDRAGSWLAASCTDGLCVGPSDNCTTTKSPDYCGGASIDFDAGGGGDSSRGGDAGWDGSSGGDGGFVAPVCVDGTSSSCYGTHQRWTGTQCCVDGPTTCGGGTSSSCYGSGMHWTGTLCCVDGPYETCTDGTSSACYGSGMHWTGSRCCVDGPVTCTSGTSSSCYGTGQYWTGTLCCVK